MHVRVLMRVHVRMRVESAREECRVCRPHLEVAFACVDSNDTRARCIDQAYANGWSHRTCCREGQEEGACVHARVYYTCACGGRGSSCGTCGTHRPKKSICAISPAPAQTTTTNTTPTACQTHYYRQYCHHSKLDRRAHHGTGKVDTLDAARLQCPTTACCQDGAVLCCVGGGRAARKRVGR